MSGEAEAVGKIIDGLKELGKTLLTPDPPKRADEPRVGERNTRDVWDQATRDSHYLVPKRIVDDILEAVEDPAVSQYLPRKVYERAILLRGCKRG